MKIATYHQGATTKVGVVVDDRIYDLAAALAAAGADTASPPARSLSGGGEAAVSAAQNAISKAGSSASQPLERGQAGRTAALPWQVALFGGQLCCPHSRGGRGLCRQGEDDPALLFQALLYGDCDG